MSSDRHGKSSANPRAAAARGFATLSRGLPHHRAPGACPSARRWETASSTLAAAVLHRRQHALTQTRVPRPSHDSQRGHGHPCSLTLAVGRAQHITESPQYCPTHLCLIRRDPSAISAAGRLSRSAEVTAANRPRLEAWAAVAPRAIWCARARCARSPPPRNPYAVPQTSSALKCRGV